MPRIMAIGGRVPFSVEQGLPTCAAARVLCFLAQNIAVHQGELNIDVIASIDGRVRWIVMGGHEVDRRPCALALVQELVNPGVVYRGGTTNAQLRAEFLERASGPPVQLEKLRPRTAPERVQSGLVPYLEEPLLDLRKAIPRDCAPGQTTDERAPIIPIPWWGNVAAIVEDCGVARRDCRRHEG